MEDVAEGRVLQPDSAHRPSSLGSDPDVDDGRTKPLWLTPPIINRPQSLPQGFPEITGPAGAFSCAGSTAHDPGNRRCSTHSTSGQAALRTRRRAAAASTLPSHCESGKSPFSFPASPGAILYHGQINRGRRYRRTPLVKARLTNKWGSRRQSPQWMRRAMAREISSLIKLVFAPEPRPQQ